MFRACAFSFSAAKARSFLALDGLLDRAAPLLVVLAFEDRRQRDLQFLDQVMDRLLRMPARVRPAATMRHRTVRCVEVVDVDPIGRQRAGARGIVQQAIRTDCWMRAPGAPIAKMLKPRWPIAVPKSIASCARGCSSNPGNGASSAVVLKSSPPISAGRYRRSAPSGSINCGAGGSDCPFDIHWLPEKFSLKPSARYHPFGNYARTRRRRTRISCARHRDPAAVLRGTFCHGPTPQGPAGQFGCEELITTIVLPASRLGRRSGSNRAWMCGWWPSPESGEAGDDRAVGEHRLEPGDVCARGAVAQRAGTAGVAGDDAPDRARVTRARSRARGPRRRRARRACRAASVTPAPTVTCPSARSTSPISVRRVSETSTSWSRGNAAADEPGVAALRHDRGAGARTRRHDGGHLSVSAGRTTSRARPRSGRCSRVRRRRAGRDR